MADLSARRVAARHLAKGDVYDELLALWKREFPRGRGHKGRGSLEFEVRDVFKVGDPTLSVDPNEEKNDRLEAKLSTDVFRAMKLLLGDRKVVKKHTFGREGEDFTLLVELK